MADADEESKRVSIQVASISTQLIESIEKQSALEEQLHHIRKENDQLKEQVKELPQLRNEYNKLQAEHQEILKHNIGLGRKLESESKEKLDAKEEVSKLQKEVEELTASLFDEANKMVSDARRETHETKLRNDSLVSQLKEKDLLLDNLQSQLKELKNTILDKDSESVSRFNSTDDLNRSVSHQQTNTNAQVLYSPTVNSIRFDLKLFSEFKKFVKSLDSIDSIRSTDTKFLKKLISDDVEPALRLDVAAGISWLSKRPLMSAIIDGRVVIEPVSGINETYRLNFQSNKTSETDIKSNLYSYPAHSPPVAVDQPCAVCGESRNDILEHSRLYTLKVQSKTDDTGLSSQTSAAVIASQYPLCSYCLFRVRSTCELFAFLRSLKTDAWKLDNEIVIKKAWAELSRLRSKLFWSKVGIWDIDENIVTTRITPNLDDHVSKAVEVNPSRLSYMSSVESLDELPNTASASTTGSTVSQAQTAPEYKSSPLSNELSEENSDVKIVSMEELQKTNSLQSTVDEAESAEKENEKEDEKEDEKEEEKNQEQEQDHEGEHYETDLFDSYSQDNDDDGEEEEETEEQTKEKLAKLSIDTSETPESPLDPGAKTPIITQSGKVSDTETETPTKGSFDFEAKDSPKAKEDRAASNPSTKSGSEDETEFVDA